MNRGENKEFDKQLRDKFEGFRPEVPKGLWDKIATQLDEAEPRSVVAMPAKRRRFPTWWMAAAAVLLVACGVLYWQSRPVSVTYLHAHVDAEAEPEEAAVEPSTPEEAPEPLAEPLDLERLKRVFAKKGRQVKEPKPLSVVEGEEQPEEALPIEAVEPQQLAVNERTSPSPILLPKQRDSLENGQTEIAGVPDIEPLVVLEDEEEMMLASTEQRKQPFGISNILNYVVGTVDQRDEKLVTFSNDEEGSLKLDFNFGLAKNKKRKLK